MKQIKLKWVKDTTDVRSLLTLSGVTAGKVSPSLYKTNANVVGKRWYNQRYTTVSRAPRAYNHIQNIYEVDNLYETNKPDANSSLSTCDQGIVSLRFINCLRLEL